ncbi:hypothetical protein [Ancylobacter sp. FA202]|uniref:hypothetical protein n=1 Tax=Ancylobacter sp. FA202 TaxID=1111106 RepID=UPI00035CF8C8|nr:hypothetical protein [Ancylobacter sp. FA202]
MLKVVAGGNRRIRRDHAWLESGKVLLLLGRNTPRQLLFACTIVIAEPCAKRLVELGNLRPGLMARARDDGLSSGIAFVACTCSMAFTDAG